MASESTVSQRQHVELAFDACLITSGLFALVTLVSLGVVALVGTDKLPTWIQVVGSMLMLATGIGGPAITWSLHHRRFTPIAILGAFVGAGAAGLLMGSGAVLSMPLGWIVSPISTSEFAGPIALLVLVAVGFVGVTAWLLVDAVRDSAATRREHRSLDIVRMASAVSVAVLAVVVAALTMTDPSGEIAEAFIFALAFGIAGGVIVAGADLMSTLVEHRKGDAAGPSPA